MAKRRWLSFIKRFFISETGQNGPKEKKRRWVFGKHKLKRLTSQSTVIERPQAVAKSAKNEGESHVVQEFDEPKQVANGNISVKEWKNDAATKIQTVFRGFFLTIGGGGGNIGKSINFGGVDGGDDDGDDDDYFDKFDDGDEGDDGGLFRRRIILTELFDQKFLEAVLNEWQNTMMDLPSGLRQAYEMGLVSSAQLVKYIAMNARSTTGRFISRSLPQGLSRTFIGRMITDPTFLYRFLLEQAATIGSSVLWEVKNRKEKYPISPYQNQNSLIWHHSGRTKSRSNKVGNKCTKVES